MNRSGNELGDIQFATEAKNRRSYPAADCSKWPVMDQRQRYKPTGPALMKESRLRLAQPMPALGLVSRSPAARGFSPFCLTPGSLFNRHRVDVVGDG